MPSLTFREQLLVVMVLAAVLTGVAVKHWRDARPGGARGGGRPHGTPGALGGCHGFSAL